MLPAEEEDLLATLNGGVDAAGHAHELRLAILEYLCAGGHTEAGRVLAEEHGIACGADRLGAFDQLESILAGLRAGDVGPALAWSEAEAEWLAAQRSDLRFTLHRARFVRLLRSSTADQALAYSRRHLSSFAESHLADVERLMAAILWAGKLSQSPYADMLRDTDLDRVCRAFKRDYLARYDLPVESTLDMALRVGVRALPRMVKCATMLRGKTGTLAGLDRLPVDIPLEDDERFHSVFACPVTKEVCNRSPVLLPCGHVLGRASMAKLGCGKTTFKCPYCPREVAAGNCLDLSLGLPPPADLTAATKQPLAASLPTPDNRMQID